ncbi:hypothetical protein B0H19DRAFT_1241084 [Mycena capillaripes]|nr:hypothetical protein B0H19DRAFT_1241084 [Mycena capillaripes]
MGMQCTRIRSLQHLEELEKLSSYRVETRMRKKESSSAFLNGKAKNVIQNRGIQYYYLVLYAQIFSDFFEIDTAKIDAAGPRPAGCRLVPGNRVVVEDSRKTSRGRRNRHRIVDRLELGRDVMRLESNKPGSHEIYPEEIGRGDMAVVLQEQCKSCRGHHITAHPGSPAPSVSLRRRVWRSAISSPAFNAADASYPRPLLLHTLDDGFMTHPACPCIICFISVTGHPGFQQLLFSGTTRRRMRAGGLLYYVDASWLKYSSAVESHIARIGMTQLGRSFSQNEYHADTEQRKYPNPNQLKHRKEGRQQL